jgi:hypothetical protein
MAKKRSKNNQILNATPSHQKQDDAPEQNTGIVSAMGANAKTIGTTIAGVLIGEIIEAAVERLVQKNKTTSTNASDEVTADENGDRPDGVAVVQNAALGIQDNLDDVKPAVREAIATIKAAVSNVTPKIADVVDALKTAPQQSQQSIQHSASGIGNMTKAVMREAVNTAKGAVAVASDKSELVTKKGKKKGKKKSKKS